MSTEAEGRVLTPERDGLCGEHPGVWLVNVTGKGWVCPSVLTRDEKIMLGIPSGKSGVRRDR